MLAEKIKHEPVLKLYPNPAQNSITIEYKAVAENSKLFFIDMLGSVIEVKELHENGGKLSVNTSSFPNGIYLARLENSEYSSLMSKFIIQK